MEVKPITWIGTPANFYVVSGIIHFKNTTVPPVFICVGVVAFTLGKARDIAEHLAFAQPAKVDQFQMTNETYMGKVHGIAQSCVTGKE